MRFLTLSILFHFCVFAAFLSIKPDLRRPVLQEQIGGDVIVADFVFEPLVEKGNISVKPIEADKQAVSKALLGHSRLVSPKKVLTEFAKGSANVVAARAPVDPAQTATKIFEAKKVNPTEYQRVAPSARQLSDSSVIIRASAIPIKGSDFSSHLHKTCTSNLKSGLKPLRKQNESQEHKQITITNLVGLHPAHREVLQGKVTSISTLLGAKPLGRHQNISTLLHNSQNQSTQISCD